jgi:hypothetical protein
MSSGEIGQYCSWRLASTEDGEAVAITELDGKSWDREIDEAIATGNPLDLSTPVVWFDTEGKAHRIK